MTPQKKQTSNNYNPRKNEQLIISQKQNHPLQNNQQRQKNNKK